MAHLTEFIVEDAALAWLKALGYAVLNGPAIAASKPAMELGGADAWITDYNPA